jgi:transcriptional regulator with XRE-family HTH domain
VRCYINPRVLQKGPDIKLAENLRLLRERSGLTQKRIAQYLFIDRSTYSYYECGKTQPNLKILTQLSDLYGVSIDAMIGHLPQDSKQLVHIRNA